MTRHAYARCERTSQRAVGRRGGAIGPRGNSGRRHGAAPADLAGALWSALDSFDDAGAQAAFDRLVAAFSTEAVVEKAILPYLRALGDRWSDGDASVAQEHFASGLLRARLLGLARGWDRGAGPRALLACPPGEHHDLGLIILGLALRDRGWRVTFLGPDTPIETLAAAADQLAPDVVVLSSLAREPLARPKPRSPGWPPADRAAGRSRGRRRTGRTCRARLLTGGPLEPPPRCRYTEQPLRGRPTSSIRCDRSLAYEHAGGISR